MAARFNEATLRAIHAVRAGVKPYRAALDEGIQPSTLYRALTKVAALAAAEQRQAKPLTEARAAIQYARITAQKLRQDMKRQAGCLPAFKEPLDQLDKALEEAERITAAHAAA